MKVREESQQGDFFQHHSLTCPGGALTTRTESRSPHRRLAGRRSVPGWAGLTGLTVRVQGSPRGVQTRPLRPAPRRQATEVALRCRERALRHCPASCEAPSLHWNGGIQGCPCSGGRAQKLPDG